MFREVGTGVFFNQQFDMGMYESLDLGDALAFVNYNYSLLGDFRDGGLYQK